MASMEFDYNGDKTGKKIQVLFGNEQAISAALPKNSAIITPTRDGWNDFGFRIRVRLRFNVDGIEQEVEGGAYIGFLSLADGAPNGTLWLQELIKEMNQLTLPTNETHHFFTMLPNMEAYRSLVRILGPAKATRLLLALKDLVALGEFKPSTNWLPEAIKTPVFSLAFIRESEGFFAFHNAAPLLRGLELEEFGRLSPKLEIKFQLAGLATPHHLKFQFDHEADLPKRISVLIGKNGVGKSQTLGRIAKAALDGSKALTDGTPEGRPMLSRLLAFAPTNEAEAVFPSGPGRRSRVWYQRYSLNRSRRFKRKDSLANLIVQLARSRESIKDKRRWKIFIDALAALNAGQQLALRTNDDYRPYLHISELGSGSEQIRLERFASIDAGRDPVRLISGTGYPLSSGEISFVRFAAQVSLHIENGSLLLVDEPETHLHPNFISRYVSLLDMLLESTGSAAIVSTHSAYFVREVFREQVTVLRIDDDGQVLAEKPRLRTFGADVGAISYFVFGEDEPSSLAATVEQRLRAKQWPWKRLYETYGKELSREFLSSLRDSEATGVEE